MTLSATSKYRLGYATKTAIPKFDSGANEHSNLDCRHKRDSLSVASCQHRPRSSVEMGRHEHRLFQYHRTAPNLSLRIHPDHSPRTSHTYLALPILTPYNCFGSSIPVKCNRPATNCRWNGKIICHQPDSEARRGTFEFHSPDDKLPPKRTPV